MVFMFDLNNLAMRVLHLPQVHADSEEEFNPDFWSYKIFDDIFNFVTTYSNGEPIEDIILACDHKEGYWRKDIYSPYKANRKKDNKMCWPKIWEEHSRFKEAVKELLPIKVLEIAKCEADDIIAVLARNAKTPCVVSSGDCDYLQLLSDNIRVVQPHHGEQIFPSIVKVGAAKVFCNDADEFVKYSVLTGQGRKDNVFNVLTPTEWVPNDAQKRMAPFGVKKIQKLIDAGELDSFLKTNGLEENYSRNQELIDFTCIPKDIQETIIQADTSYVKKAPRIIDFLTEYEWSSYLQGKFDYVELLMDTVYQN